MRNTSRSSTPSRSKDASTLADRSPRGRTPSAVESGAMKRATKGCAAGRGRDRTRSGRDLRLMRLRSTAAGSCPSVGREPSARCRDQSGSHLVWMDHRRESSVGRAGVIACAGSDRGSVANAQVIRQMLRQRSPRTGCARSRQPAQLWVVRSSTGVRTDDSRTLLDDSRLGPACGP
jgi:hypothetical protein